MVNLRSRERFGAGDIVADCWVGGASRTNAELLAKLGYDSVTIDMQHAPIDFTDVVATILTLSGTGVTVTVRVPGNDPYLTQRVLDAGADGVMCPMVNTAEEARRFVSAVRYPPLGTRSLGAYRTSESMVDHFRNANTQLLSIVQIETVEAMENLDAIAATEGLDMLFVGPGDMEVSYGGDPVVDYTNEATAERHKRIVDAAHRAGKLAGMLTFSEADTRIAIGWGYDQVSCAMESVLLAGAGAQALRTARDLAAQRDALRNSE